MKKSMADMIIVDPTMLDAIIVTNLTQSNVVTAKTIAPPPTATEISRNYLNQKVNKQISFGCNCSTIGFRFTYAEYVIW